MENMKDLNDRNPFVHIHYCKIVGGTCISQDSCESCTLKKVLDDNRHN